MDISIYLIKNKTYHFLDKCTFLIEKIFFLKWYHLDFKSDHELYQDTLFHEMDQRIRIRI